MIFIPFSEFLIDNKPNNTSNVIFKITLYILFMFKINALQNQRKLFFRHQKDYTGIKDHIICLKMMAMNSRM